MANYYVSTGGSNGAPGTMGQPWRNISYACNSVVTPGDIINVGAGIFVESSQCAPRVGVSLVGTGDTTEVRFSIGSSATGFSLYSSSETAGNQSISYMKFNGNSLSTWRAIYVEKRSYVHIHHCTFEDFFAYAVSFYGSGSYQYEATSWSVDNKIYSNTIDNCAGYDFGSPDPKNDGAGGYASITVDAQDGMEIYDNTITQFGRSGYANGYLIKGVAGYNKNMKIHDNNLDREPVTSANESLVYDFCIELWHNRGGVEIYDNVITGGSIDISGHKGNTKGSYTYSTHIHDNIIGCTALSDSPNPKGILLEVGVQDVLIEKNHIFNVSSGVWQTIYDDSWVGINHYHIQNITIRYNIFENIGVSSSGPYNDGGIDCLNSTTSGTTTYDGYYVYNNVLIGTNNSVPTKWGIRLPYVQELSNVYIKNNIIMNFDHSPIYAAGSGMAVDTMEINNNIFYQNGNSNEPYFSITPTNYTHDTPIKDDPDFLLSNNFHLQESSPAIDAGEYVGITTDFDGNSVSDPPEIGAYEEGSYSPPTDLAGWTRGYATVGAPTGGKGSDWVPDTTDFTLQEVCTVIPPSTTLVECFYYSIDCKFDPVYKGDKDRLSNFRNYGPRCDWGMKGIIPDSENKATVTGTLTYSTTGTSSLVGVIPDTDNKATVEGRLSMPPFIQGVSAGLATVIGTLVPLSTVFKRGYGALYNWYAVNGNSGVGEIISSYGALYNWYASTYSTGGASIAPSGWHVPTNTELSTLMRFIDSDGTATVNDAGGYLKEIGITHWSTPNTGATDTYGFSARGGGRRSYLGAFASFGQKDTLWSTTESNTDNAHCSHLNYNDAVLLTSYGGTNVTADKNYGFTIRLIKDDSTDPGSLTDYDGNVYPTVKIGNQVWIAQNFKAEHYNDGTVIPIITGTTEWASDTSGAMCYYDNDEIVEEELKTLAPAGWHIPTEAELDTLFTNAGGGLAAGGHLKETGLIHWLTPNTDADNSTGFSLLGSGTRSATTGAFSGIQSSAYSWTSQDYGDSAKDWSALYNSAGIYTGAVSYKFGHAIRLIKDDSIDPGSVTDYDGNIYQTIKIGDQVWMCSNLDVHHYTDGTAIPEVIPNAEWAALTTGAYCYYGGNDNIDGGTSGRTDGDSDVTGTPKLGTSRLAGVIHAGSGEMIGVYGAGAPHHAFSYENYTGTVEYGFSFTPQTNLIFSEFTAFITKVGFPYFQVTFTLATANADGTPDTDVGVLMVTNAADFLSYYPVLVVSSTPYSLTAGTHYVIYMTYSSIVTNNATNRICVLYTKTDDTASSNVVSKIGSGTWEVFSTGEVKDMMVTLGGVIGTMRNMPSSISGEVNADSNVVGDLGEKASNQLIGEIHAGSNVTGVLSHTGTTVYGLLYNWWVGTDSKNIANTGWHMPTSTEWTTLRTYLGGQTVAGGKMKETGTSHWTTPNTGADNSSGFTALPAGQRQINTRPTFISIGYGAAFESSTDYSTTAFLGGGSLSWDSAAWTGVGALYTKKNGYSIRLLKDSTTLTNGQTSTYTGNDGKVYNTICIDTQEWMSENLAETKFRDGSTISYVVSDLQWFDLTSAAYCIYGVSLPGAKTNGTSRTTGNISSV